MASAIGCPLVTAAGWPVARQVQQLLFVSGQFSDLSASTAEAAAGAGGFVLFGEPPAGSGPAIQSGIAGLVGAARGAGQVVPWMSTDEEGGEVARLADVLGDLPAPRTMAEEWTPAQVEAAVSAHAAAMASLGISVDLAPVLDTAPPTDPYADESQRSFSAVPQTVAAYGEAFIQGLESAGIVPVIKHFPGLGHAVGDTDLGPATDPPLGSLQTDDLIPFAAALSAGAPVVMVGHPIVPGLSGGLPASLSPATYSYLRQQLGFTGVAITDALDAGAIVDAGYSQAAAAVKAIQAGADMVLVDASAVPSVVAALEQAVTTRQIPLSSLYLAVARVLAAKGLSYPHVTATAAADPAGGLWYADEDGCVAGLQGARPAINYTHGLPAPVVGMAATPDGKGYWLVTSNGAVLPFGDAHSYGSAANVALNQPVVGMVATRDGKGYWLVAADGGVFRFGDARYTGSVPGLGLRAPSPIVGMTATHDGGGYWLTAANGTVYPFGDAHKYGGASGLHLAAPIVGIEATADGNGYWLVAADGGVFRFGDAAFYGSGPQVPLTSPCVALVPGSNGYTLVLEDGRTVAFPR